MKRIDKWVASDGSEWSTEQDAYNRETLIHKIEIIESILPDHPNDTDFSNGDGYIQHDPKKLKAARYKLVELADEYIGSFMSSYDLKSYAFGRYLNDSTRYSPLYGLYHRIVSCIDENTWREYGQPYYANNPKEAKQIQLNGE